MARFRASAAMSSLDSALGWALEELCNITLGGVSLNGVDCFGWLGWLLSVCAVAAGGAHTFVEELVDIFLGEVSFGMLCCIVFRLGRGVGSCSNLFTGPFAIGFWE
jgi:hypothetical protein